MTPKTIASDFNGTVFVGDEANLRIDKFLDGALPVAG